MEYSLSIHLANERQGQGYSHVRKIQVQLEVVFILRNRNHCWDS